MSGTVTVKGTPATGGRSCSTRATRIASCRPGSADIGPDGSYTIKTLTGDNRVTFEGEIATKNVGVGLVKEYARVESGDNHINFDVLGEGSKKLLYDVSKKGIAKGKK